MNFKMQNKQNQLIERISDTTSSCWCGYCSTSSRGPCCKLSWHCGRESFTFENNEEGFTSLLNWIQESKTTKKPRYNNSRNGTYRSLLD